MTNEKLSEALLASKLLTPEQLGNIVEAHQRQGGALSRHIIESGYIEEASFRDFLSSVFRVAAVDLGSMEIDNEIIKLVPEDIATRFQLVPVGRQGRVLEVAMANPDNLFAIDDLKFYTGLEVRPLVAPESAIKDAIDRYYDRAQTLKSVMDEMDGDIDVIDDDDELLATREMEAESQAAPVVKLVNSLLADAVQRGASDIHVEPQGKGATEICETWKWIEEQLKE